MQICGLSDSGLARYRNEDAIAWDERKGIAALADGLGGHPAGDVAARLAVGHVLEEARCDGWEPNAARTRDLIAHANQLLLEHVRQDPSCIGMGTTLVVACVAEQQVTVAHVGDSRAYRLHGGRLERLTHDHTLAQLAVDEQLLTEEEARYSPQRHRLTQAVGLGPDLSVDICRKARIPGDLYLLCSDGITGELTDQDILGLLLEHRRKPHEAAQALISAALQAGGYDNASVVILRV